MIFNWAVSKFLDDSLFAGIIKQYSKKAIPQLIKIIKNKGIELSLNFRLPYHANVIKTFETTSNKNGQNLINEDICKTSQKVIYYTKTQISL